MIDSVMLQINVSIKKHEEEINRNNASEMVSHAYNLLGYLKHDHDIDTLEGCLYSLNHHVTFLSLRQRLQNLGCLPDDLASFKAEEELIGDINVLQTLINKFKKEAEEESKTSTANSYIEKDCVQPYRCFVNDKGQIKLDVFDGNATLWTDNQVIFENPQRLRIVNPEENFPYGSCCFNVVKISSDEDAATPMISFHSVKAVLDMR